MQIQTPLTNTVGIIFLGNKAVQLKYKKRAVTAGVLSDGKMNTKIDKCFNIDPGDYVIMKNSAGHFPQVAGCKHYLGTEEGVISFTRKSLVSHFITLLVSTQFNIACGHLLPALLSTRLKIKI